MNSLQYIMTWLLSSAPFIGPHLSGALSESEWWWYMKSDRWSSLLYGRLQSTHCCKRQMTIYHITGATIQSIIHLIWLTPFPLFFFLFPRMGRLQKLQTLLISPLNELSTTTYADVRQKQVDCVLQLLHSSGDSISFGWPLFLNIIGAISNTQGLAGSPRHIQLYLV